MACNISAGRVEACKDQIAGLKSVYFINYTTGSFTVDADDSISAFPTPALTAYKYELKGQNGFVQTVNSSRDNGTTYFTQEVNITLKHLDPTMHLQFKLMAYGRPQIVVHTLNGDAFLVGKDQGADMTAGSISSGVAYGDLSGYTATFTAMEKLPANFLDGSTITNPFAGVTNPPTIVSA